MLPRWCTDCNQVLPAAASRARMDLPTCLDRHNPRWEGEAAPQGFWATGAPLGNGDFGALLYGPPENLTLVLGKNDLWMRTTTRSHFPGGGYAELLRIYREQDQAAFARLLPADPNWADTFLPSSLINAGFFRLHLAEPAGVRRFVQELSLRDATCRLTFEAPGLDRMWSLAPDFAVSAFVSAPHEVLVVRVSRHRLPLRSFTWRLGRERHVLLPPATVAADGNTAWLVQDLPQGDRHALVLRQVGLPVTMTATQRSVVGESDSATDTEVVFFLAAATTRDSADPLGLASTRVATAAAAGVAAVEEAHVRYWQDFWSRSWVACADAAVERTWYLSNYLTGSILRPGKVSPGLQGMWCRENQPPWQADFHGNTNIQAVYQGLLGANRLAWFEPYARLYHEMLPQCRRGTRDFFGVEGARLPHAGSLEGFEQCEPNWPPLAVSLAPSSWLARLFWWAWQHLGDRQFLAEVAWPVLRDVALFYGGILEWSGKDGSGRYRLEPSIYGESDCTSLKGWGTSAGYDLGAIQAALTQALAAAAVLGDPEGLSARWQALLDALPELPVDAQDRWTTFPGAEPMPAGSFCYPVFPCEVASAFHGTPALRARARASWAWYREHSTSAWCGGVPVAAAARMGDAAWAFAATRQALACGDQASPRAATGLTASIAAGVMQADHGPGLALALNSMLGLGVDGALVFFPAWPADVDVAFHSLRFPGPVLAAGEQREGRVRYVCLQPLVAQPLRVLNPFDPLLWGGGPAVAVTVSRLDTGAVVLTADCQFREPLCWDGEPEVVYVLTPVAAPLSDIPERQFPGNPIAEPAKRM